MVKVISLLGCNSVRIRVRMLFNVYLLVSFIRFRVTLVLNLVILLNLAQLRDQRELHLVKLMKSFVCGNCHPAMKLLVQQQPHGALSVGEVKFC